MLTEYLKRKTRLEINLFKKMNNRKKENMMLLTTSLIPGLFAPLQDSALPIT